ncbi:MAG TPA: MASE1 domain-containing protein [Candidatus Cryosericum sp.]|nr:MASE1 domain-containing protein [Candidatus Cryosericum sp.]
MAALALVYYLAGKFGLLLAFANQSASAVWPPTGIALAAVVLLGPRMWPGIWIGAFFVNLTTTGFWLTSIGIATGNTLEAVVGGALALRFSGGRRAFEDAGSVFRYILVAAVPSTAISATIGVLSLGLASFMAWSEGPHIWLTWWLGDLVSAMVIAPLLLIWSTTLRPRWGGRVLAEALAMLAVLGATALIVFGGFLPERFGGGIRSFMAIPPLLWAAFRFGPLGAATSVFLVAWVALWGTLGGYGPLVVSDPNDSLLLLQSFVGTVTMTNLVLGAAVFKVRRVEDALRKSEAELQRHVLEIEARVQRRTADLSRSRQELQAQIDERRQLEAQIAGIIEREHLRLGSELHDGLGQQLAGIGFMLAGLREKLRDVSPERAQDARQVQKLVEQSIQETRSLARRSYPVELEGLGLLPTLKNLARGTEIARGVTCTVRSDGSPCAELRGPTAIQLFRIVQEAVHNAVKHGRAQRLAIDLTTVNGTVNLTITDDGVGLPGDLDGQHGMGLRIMKYRARMVGGTLEVRNGPQGGVVVACSVPAGDWAAYPQGDGWGSQGS